MPMTVSGVLGSALADGTRTPLVSAVILVYPASNQYRVQYAGTGAFIPLTYRSDDPNLPDPYRFGYSTTTDGTGAYSFKIPLASETHQVGAAPIEWSILLPDGRQYTGVASAAGPYSLDDLLQTQGWRITQGLQLVAPLNGVTQDGTASVAGSTTATVNFAGGNMPNTNYRVLIRPSADAVTLAVPEFDVTSKTIGGFTVTFGPSFTGTFDWFVKG